MTRSLPLIAVAVLGLTVNACAPTAGTGEDGAPSAAAPARPCFSPDLIRNFRQGSQVGQIFLRADRNQVFELNAAGGCTNLDFAMRMAVVPDGAALAGGRSCVGDWVRIVVPGSTAATSTCRARISRVLTEAEVEALPSRQRP